MSIIERILKVLEEKNSKMSELCMFLDINTSTMANWKTRNSDPPAKYIIPICEFLKISPDYLLTGEEKEKTSPSITEDEQELLSVYQNLGRRGKAKTLATAYDELDLLKSNR